MKFYNSYIFIPLLFLLSYGAYSQSGELDSLKRNFQDGNVYTSIAAANEIAWIMRYEKMDSALLYAERALFLSDSINNDTLRSTSLRRLGVISKNIGNYPRAIECYIGALEIALRFKNKKNIASCYNNLGIVYRNIGDYEKALSYYLKSLKIKEDFFPKSKTLCRTYKNLGNFYSIYRHDSDTAMYYLKEAISIALELKEAVLISDINSDIGMVHESKGDYGLAKKYLHEALNGFEKIEDNWGQAYTLSNIGLVYKRMNQFLESERFYTQAITKNKDIGDKLGASLIYGNLGDLMLAKEDFYRAKEYFSAFLEMSGELGNPSNEKKAHIGLSKALESLGDYKEAIEHRKIYNKIEDTLFTTEKNKEIELLRARFNTDKREQEIKFLNTIRDQQAKALIQSERLRNGSMLVTILVMIIGGLMVAYFNEQRKAERREALRKEEINELRLNEVLQQQEMKVLEAALEGQEEERNRIAGMLHGEVGSVLHTVKMYFSSWEEKVFKKMEAERQQFDKANELLDKVTEEIREVSHSLDAGIVSNLGLKVALAEMAEGISRTGKLEVNLDLYNVEERLNTGKEITIFRVIQEVVGNVLKHSGASKLDLSLTKSTDELTIIIEDNGKGFDIVGARKKTGLGLRNIEGRVSQLGGNVVFDSMLGKGTTVIINLNV